MSVLIRSGATTDATALVKLAARTFSETFAADNRPEDIALHNAQTYGAAQQQKELGDPDIATLLVEVDGQLAGYAQLRSGDTPRCVAGEKPIELGVRNLRRQVSSRPALFFSRIGASIAVCSNCLSSSSLMSAHFDCGKGNRRRAVLPRLSKQIQPF